MRSTALVHAGAAFEGRPGLAAPVRAHLCFVAPFLWPVLSGDASHGLVGGAEVQQALLARLLRGAGYRVSVITMDFGQPDGVEVDGIVVRKTFRPQAGVPVLRYLHPRLTSTWRALKEVDADLYYCRAASLFVGVVAEHCRRTGKRALYAGASDADFVPGHRQIRYARDRLLYEHGLRRVDGIVVQNTAQLEACRKNFGREAVLIPSCYQLPAGARPGARKDVVLWAARVSPGKRAELFLELARALPQRRFVLVGGAGGDEAYYQKVREAAAALPNVECTGFLPLAQADAWFDRARVVVNTSHYEGMPNTFLQAWARGVPTAATVDVGVPVHKVFDGVEAGAAEIERLFADERYWEARGRASREYFQRVHACEAVLAKYVEVLEALLK